MTPPVSLCLPSPFIAAAQVRLPLFELSVGAIGGLWHTNMSPTLLHFVILVSMIDTVASAALRSPLNQYFTRDKKGLNIFDYNARGIVPDKITDLGKPLSSDPANVADPKMGTTREALFRAQEKKKLPLHFFKQLTKLNLNGFLSVLLSNIF